MKDSIILDIYSPRIRGRLHHALPLSIVPEQEDRFDHWFYSNYIQLSCERDLDNGSQLNFNGAIIWNHKYPHFRVISLLRSDIDMLQEDILTFVKRAISGGYYFHCYIDEFYLPFEFQGERHIIRDILIHGYDIAEGIIHALGYKKDHQLGTIKICAQAFLESYQIVGDSITWAHDCHLYKLRSDIDYQFDVINVMELLDDYIHSRNTSERLRAITNPKQYYYGIEAVRHYTTLLGQSQDGVMVSSVHSYILWEHKKIMHQRMKFIYALGGGYEKDKFLIVIEKYEEVVKKADIIRLLILRYNTSFNRELIVKAISQIEKLIEMETDILIQFYNILKRNGETEAATLC